MRQVVRLVHPRVRKPLLALAAVVALSRVNLGVHWAKLRDEIKELRRKLDAATAAA